MPQQTTTGPVPPQAVIERDAIKALEPAFRVGAEATLSVPGYAWRHGCGPTAVGMVVGYYDGAGYDDLIPGDASTQTEAVNQAIASQDSPSSPRHYEDYSLPMDTGQPSPLPDKSEPPAGDEHTHDSIADFMRTSWSSEGNFYGWSWSSHIEPAFTGYVNLQNPSYNPICQQYWMSNSTLTWSVLTTEIDNGRPMTFLVDTDADGGTDHLVTVVGYRDTPSLQYGCLDTWFPYADVRWVDFQQMASGQPWGIWGGWSFSLEPLPGGDSYEPDNTSLQANWISDGSPQTHSIVPADDVDWVKFSLSAESEVVIETSGSTGDTRMWLYDDSINQIEFNDDGGSGGFSRIDRLCASDPLPAGTYYVKIDEYENNDEIASYDITLTVTTCTDSYEPDNTSLQANWISDGSPQTHSIVPADDVDWVKFSLSAAESEVVIETSGSAGDTQMWLYDESINQIEFNDDGGIGLFSRIDRLCASDPLPAGTYYVKIDEYDNNDEISSYDITLTVTDCSSVPGDSYEPDNTYLQANWISDGSPQTHSIVPASDVDWVKFSLGIDSEVVIETYGSTGDTRMWLYDDSINQIEFDDDDGIGLFSRIDRSCASNPLPAGTYYVKVDEYGNNDEIPNYDITLTVTTCPGSYDPDLDEDGDVDADDLGYFTDSWLIISDCEAIADFNGDCDVNFFDFALFALLWGT